MANKRKNENLMDSARTARNKKRKEGASASCGHSENVLPYLISTPVGPLPYNQTATDELSELRRLYKKKYGFKPVGKSAEELKEILQSLLE